MKAAIAKKAYKNAEPDILRIFKNPEPWDGGLTAKLDPIKKAEFLKMLEMALVAIKQKKDVFLMCSLSKIEKVNLEWLYTYGTETQISAHTFGRKVGEQVCSLAKLYKESDFVCMCDDKGIPYNDYNFQIIEKEVEKIVEKEVIKIIEKEVIKEVRVIDSSSKIAPKTILKAMQNAKHKLSKTYQPDLVELILNQLKTELKL